MHIENKTLKTLLSLIIIYLTRRERVFLDNEMVLRNIKWAITMKAKAMKFSTFGRERNRFAIARKSFSWNWTLIKKEIYKRKHQIQERAS